MSRVTASIASSGEVPATAALSPDDRRIAEWLFILTFCVCAYFYAGAGWNQNSQFDLTRAIVEHHTFAVDAYASNTGDVSRHGGHVYANKAPGLAWLAALPYAVIHALETAGGVDVSDPRVVALNCFLCTATVVAPLSAIVPALLYGYARRRREAALWAALVALAVALATEQLPYSTLLMVHAPSGALMLLALRSRRSGAGGLAAGLAVLMNYLCAPAVVLFALLRPRREALKFLAGAVPAGVALLVYQRICFGSATSTIVTGTDPRFLSKGALFGVLGRPSLEALYGITISPYRGLFYFAPVLIAAVAGLVFWWQRGEARGELLAILAITLFFFAFNVTFNGWEGGFAIGARYLVPLIPLWGLALLRARPRSLVVALAVLSFAINFTATAVDPQPSGTIPRPLTQYLVPLLLTGQFSPDVPITRPWSAETFTGHTSVNRLAHDEAVVFTRHAPGSAVSEWSSFNLGEPFFGAGALRSLIPIVLLLVAGVAAILWKARRLPAGADAPVEISATSGSGSC